MNTPRDEEIPQGPTPRVEAEIPAGVRTLEHDLARHAGAAAGGELGALHVETSATVVACLPPRREAEVELVRVHRLEQASLLRTAIELAGATRLGYWAFSAPKARPWGLSAWRKSCDEELFFARLDGASVPEDLHRLRVQDPSDWGNLADLALAALELERSPRHRLLLARALVLDGELERARDLLRSLLERPATPRQRARLSSTLGCVLEGLGDPAAALREHECAIALGDASTSVLSCLLWGLVCGDRARALFAVERLERHDLRRRGAGPELQRAIRRARLRFELVRGVPPTPASALSSLTLDCVCDGAPAVAQATYQLFA